MGHLLQRETLRPINGLDDMGSEKASEDGSVRSINLISPFFLLFAFWV
jgi:hypothetical protein